MINMIGRKFDRLEVTAFAGYEGDGSKAKAMWWCRCSCGGEKVKKSGKAIRKGDVQSCGCLDVEIDKTREIGEKCAKKSKPKVDVAEPSLDRKWTEVPWEAGIAIQASRHEEALAASGICFR